jgi:hypothetical protein
VDVESALGLIHHVDVGDVADVSEMHLPLFSGPKKEAVCVSETLLSPTSPRGNNPGTDSTTKKLTTFKA